MFSKSDFLDELKAGLYSAWHLAFQTNDTPYINIKPEYLTTIMLGKHLSESLATKFSPNKYMVRFEEQTKVVATKAFPAIPLPITAEDIKDRPGNVDITIYQQGQIQAITKCIIEVKFFDKSDELLKKDLDRNKEFMEYKVIKKTNQIKFAALTFYLHDKNSKTKEDAISYIAGKKTHYQNITNNYCTNKINTSLIIDTLVNRPSLSKVDINMTDEYGQPLIETEENHHIIYGVILMEKSGYQPP